MKKKVSLSINYIYVFITQLIRLYFFYIAGYKLKDLKITIKDIADELPLKSIDSGNEMAHMIPTEDMSTANIDIETSIDVLEVSINDKLTKTGQKTTCFDGEQNTLPEFFPEGFSLSENELDPTSFDDIRRNDMEYGPSSSSNGLKEQFPMVKLESNKKVCFNRKYTIIFYCLFNFLDW